MRAHKRFGVFIFVVLFGLLSLTMAGRAGTATNAVADADKQEMLRSNLQVQEQLHDTLMAIEKSRQDADAVAARNAQLLDARLSLMEKAFSTQHQADVHNLEHSYRLMLIASGTFAAVGFLVLLAAAFMQWSGASRLATVITAMRTNPAPPTSEAQVLSSQYLEQTNARFLSVIEKLEQRIESIEIGNPVQQQHLPESTSANGNGTLVVATDSASASSSMDTNGAVTLLLIKGQTLLKLDQPQAALESFNEALALDPAHADALVKKGAALERLQRLDEAIECYDRAIARDNSMTMAYLYKGGVFNRMERYSEALACYEQALKSRPKGQAANVIID